MYMPPTAMPETLATLLAQPTGSSQSDSAISVPESENSVRIGDQAGDLPPSPPSLVGGLPPPLVDEAQLDYTKATSESSVINLVVHHSRLRRN